MEQRTEELLYFASHGHGRLPVLCLRSKTTGWLMLRTAVWSSIVITGTFLLWQCFVFSRQFLFVVFRAYCSGFSIQCSVFSAQFQVIVDQCSVLGVQYVVLSIQFSVLSVPCKVFIVKCLVFLVKWFVLIVNCLVLSFECLVFPLRLSVTVSVFLSGRARAGNCGVSCTSTNTHSVNTACSYS